MKDHLGGSRRGFWNLLFYENIVLMQAIGLCPILEGATTLRYGVTLSVCMATAMLPMALFDTAFGFLLPGWLRSAVYTVGAALCLTGAAAVLNFAVSTELYASLYRFLPLIAVNAVFVTQGASSEDAAINRPSLRKVLIDTLGAILGFGLVTCLLAALRELLAFGTLWGVDMGLTTRIPAASLPFAAFLLLGGMAALLQWLRRKAARHYGESIPEEVSLRG